MPQIKSNIKTMEKDAARHAANSQVKSSVHTAIRRTTEAIAAGDAEAVKKAFDKASSVIDSAAQKGVLHKNTAARKKSRLASKVNAVKTVSLPRSNFLGSHHMSSCAVPFTLQFVAQSLSFAEKALKFKAIR